MGVLQKTADFLGVKKFGEGLATAGRVISGKTADDRENQLRLSDQQAKLLYVARQEKDPNKRRQLLELANGAKAVTSEEIDPGLNLSNKEILGSAANVALNVATPGAFKGSKAAIIGKNAAMGTAYGAASGLEKGRSASGVVGSATGGAVIGASIGVAGLLAKAAKEFIGKTTPVWMMNKAVKPALNDLRKNVKYGSKTLGEELLEEGVKGGPQKLLQIADDKTNQLEDELQRVLTSESLSEARISKQQIFPYLRDLVATKRGIPGMAGEAQRVEAIWKTMPEHMTLVEANEMKRRIYRELRDPAFKLDAKLGTKAAALKQIAKGLKTEIENTVGGTAVKDINQKLSIYGRLEDAMVDQLAREMRNNGIGLTDAVLLAGGDATSFLALLRHVGQNAETTVAQGLSKIQDAGTGPVGKATKEVVRKAGFNIP